MGCMLEKWVGNFNYRGLLCWQSSKRPLRTALKSRFPSRLKVNRFLISFWECSSTCSRNVSRFMTFRSKTPRYGRGVGRTRKHQLVQEDVWVDDSWQGNLCRPWAPWMDAKRPCAKTRHFHTESFCHGTRPPPSIQKDGGKTVPSFRRPSRNVFQVLIFKGEVYTYEWN